MFVCVLCSFIFENGKFISNIYNTFGFITILIDFFKCYFVYKIEYYIKNCSTIKTATN